MFLCVGFRSKGSARVRSYDKLGKGVLIDDSFSTQKIETGFVSSIGTFNRRKMFCVGWSVTGDTVSRQVFGFRVTRSLQRTQDRPWAQPNGRDSEPETRNSQSFSTAR